MLFRLSYLLSLALGLCPAIASAQVDSCRNVSHYKIIALPLHPVRINFAGEVLGTVTLHEHDEEDGSVAIWSPVGDLRKLAIPAGFDHAEPIGFSDSSDVAGQVHDASGKARAFSYIHGKFQLLPDSPSKAKAINRHMQIAVEKFPGGLFLWNETGLSPLGGCCGGHAFAINGRDQIAGELNDREGHYNAFVWDAKNGVQPIVPPGARSSTALSINDAGHVLVQAFSPNQIFLRENGKLTPVDLSPEFASQPLALNDCDVIVGEYGAASEYYHAFVWDKKNGFRDLNTLIDKSEGWNLDQAVDINDRGEIVGIGDHQNVSDVGFLLVPNEKPEITITKEAK
jgi:uncharacterized membrane protein